MTSGGEFVQVMRRQDFILRAKLKELNRLLVSLALEHVEVFHDKLVFLRPPYAETLSFLVEIV